MVINRITIMAALTVVVLVVVSLLGFVYLPHAEITIYPAVTSRTVTQDIVLSNTASAPDFVRFILPAKVVEKKVTQEKNIERSGVTSHDDFAHGSLTLHNDQAEAQSLLPKTHLRHEASGVFFLTDGPVRIPPQSTVRVGVTAKEKGTAGNVPPGKFLVDKLPASVQRVVFGQSDVPFSGGTVVETPLTESEITAAKEAVLEEAKKQALGEITTATGGAVIRPDLLTVRVESESVSAEPGSLASSYAIRMTVQAVGFVIDDNDLLGLTLLALRSKVAEAEEFLEYDPKSFSLSIVAADFARGQARVQGKLTGKFTQLITPTAVDTGQLAGLSVGEVQERLKSFPGVGNVEVALSPFWVTSVPTRPTAITVLVKNSSSPTVTPSP